MNTRMSADNSLELVPAGTGPYVEEANLAQVFWNRSATYADTMRWRQRTDGAWAEATFRDNARLVTELIGGLDALGAMPGDVITILSETRWEWLAADWAIIDLGGIMAPIYASSVPETIAHILRNCAARYVFVENRAQYDKLLRVEDDWRQVRNLIMFEDADQVALDSRVLSFGALRALGREHIAAAEKLADERARSIRPDDPVSIIYTSGTTGLPKGAALTHRTLLAELNGVQAKLPTVGPGMVDLLFLPLSHVLGRLEHLFTLDRGVCTVIFPSLDHLADEIRTVRPDILLSVPRVYEKAYAAILARVRAGRGADLRKRIFRWARRVGSEVSRRHERHQPVPPVLALMMALADLLVFRAIRTALGGRLQFAISGGAPLDRDILEFFHAAGVKILEGWGLTETAGAFTVNTLDDYRLGTVGRPFPGHEIRIAADGEILVRGPCVFTGYNGNPEATAEAFTADGWFQTGDIGTLDADGFLTIVDRKKELIVTAGGKKIAPQYVETLLKAIPTVSQACVYGDRKPYLVALLTLNPEGLRTWAAQHGLRGETQPIAETDKYRAYLERKVAQTNARLASFETVKRYAVLPEDFTVENGLLTPTLKIRRRSIYQRYHERFEALYVHEEK